MSLVETDRPLRLDHKCWSSRAISAWNLFTWDIPHITQTQDLVHDIKTLSRDGLCFMVEVLNADSAAWVIK
jgi:hypothetical protein